MMLVSQYAAVSDALSGVQEYVSHWMQNPNPDRGMC